MSVVAVKIYKDKIVMASDSILVYGWGKDTSNDFAKLTRANGMIIGATGLAQETSFMWNFMQTHRPESPTEKAVLDYILEFSAWKVTRTGTGIVDNTYIIAYEGKAFLVEKMFVMEIKNYKAIGAGEQYASAALYLGHSPEEAVKVSCALCCMVAEPILIEEMPIEVEK